MKLFLICIIFFSCILSCHTPVSVHKETQTATTVSAAERPVKSSNAPIYDTTQLQIQVVHNPKYATTYGVKLINLDTTHALKIQKVKLGRTEKIYSENCQRQDPELEGFFEFCVIKPNYDSVFALEVVSTTAPMLKCEVHYIVNQVKKINYTETVDTISCIIGFPPGIASQYDKGRCFWALGWGQ
jgi:hypothetical protein